MVHGNKVRANAGNGGPETRCRLNQEAECRIWNQLCGIAKPGDRKAEDGT